jgi:hypothetical protein
VEDGTTAVLMLEGSKPTLQEGPPEKWRPHLYAKCIWQTSTWGLSFSIKNKNKTHQQLLFEIRIKTKLRLPLSLAGSRKG